MQKMLKVRTVWMFAAAVAVAMLSVNLEQAQARPIFPGVFAKQYPGLKDQVKKVKCAVCHTKKKNPKKPKEKPRNIYGKALEKALGATKVKDKKKVAAAMEKIAKQASAVKGMSFGDLIKAGKLPASTE